jgi:hypothetical protein
LKSQRCARRIGSTGYVFTNIPSLTKGETVHPRQSRAGGTRSKSTDTPHYGLKEHHILSTLLGVGEGYVICYARMIKVQQSYERLFILPSCNLTIGVYGTVRLPYCTYYLVLCCRTVLYCTDVQHWSHGSGMYDPAGVAACVLLGIGGAQLHLLTFVSRRGGLRLVCGIYYGMCVHMCVS